MLATDEETGLEEFLDEAVLCENDATKPEHDAEVYVKVVCPHCGRCILWASCTPCLENAMEAINESADWVCRGCKKDVNLLLSITVLGPVR